MNRLVFLVFAAWLAGCTASGPARVKNVDAIASGSGSGLIVGSFSRAPRGPKYSYYSFYYREVGTERAKGSLRASRSQVGLGEEEFKDDFREIDAEGAIFSIELAPGSYEFFQYELYVGNGYFSSTWRSKKDFSIRFDVTPGGIIYIGEILLEPVTGRNLFGLEVPDGGTWSLRNKAERDLPLLLDLYPSLPWKATSILRQDGCSSIYEC
ncbi:MAG: hypothetical protein AB7Q97_16285 [Gammaproteobacteria bacterium]